MRLAAVNYGVSGLGLKKFSNNKHSSLFCAGVIDDEQKRFWFQQVAIQK
jgi:hypothetical protein